jgi:hypothetical protein
VRRKCAKIDSVAAELRPRGVRTWDQRDPDRDRDRDRDRDPDRDRDRDPDRDRGSDRHRDPDRDLGHDSRTRRFVHDGRRQRRARG